MNALTNKYITYTAIIAILILESIESMEVILQKNIEKKTFKF